MFAKLFENAIYDNWPMLVIFSVAMITLRFYYVLYNKKDFSFYKEVLNVFAVLYILMLFVLLTNSEANVGGGFNVIPFSEITRYTFGSNLFLLNVIGNILLFIPFGFIIGNYIKPKNILSPLFITLIVSITVELIQLNIGRSFDVDDILLNVSGSLIGYILYKILVLIKHHLPKFFQKDGLYNVICIIIIFIVILYLLKLMGVLV